MMAHDTRVLVSLWFLIPGPPLLPKVSRGAGHYTPVSIPPPAGLN